MQHLPARVVIIHGSYGNPDGNWFQWLKKEVEKLGNTAIVPKFPTPEGQNLVAWKTAFRSQVGSLTPETILVGHSLGAGFALNLLEEADVPMIRATYLIAGFLGRLGLTDYDTINETFVDKQFDWPLIRCKAGKIAVVAGDNDPYVTIEKGTELADLLAVSLQVIPGGGHLNAEFGLTSFPLLLEKMRLVLTVPGADTRQS